ncbi:lipopolysaccharide biosynthesis protein [Aerophototrophica crusticola]|uniref:Lipopolysaccharide biosynthesis protein n=1 Tax=Aerophototrophica crusticola TaxID=1709002 RepID=A0A858R4Z0_9PROT|nr:lipopolysaccharide biosynthesis protein [Rhodospirillaceae bacterium B3]
MRRLFANAGILLGGKGFNAVFSLGAMAVAARALGVEQFGILVLIHTFTQAIGEIAKFQSWQAVLRYGTPALVDGRVGDLQRLIRFTVLLDASAAVAGMVFSVALAWVLGPRFGWPAELLPAAALYVTSVLFMVTATPTGVLRLVDRFGVLSVQGTLGNLVRLLAGAAAWAWGGGIEWFLAAWYLATVVAGVYLIHAGWKELKVRGLLDGFRWRGGGLTRGFDGIWKFVFSTNLNATLELAFTHIGTLVVGWYLGPKDAALFRVARQVGEALAKPAKLLVPAIYPELARLSAAGEHKTMRDLALRSALLAGAGASLGLGLVWLAGEWLLGLVLGPDFIPAYPVMIWLVAAAVVGIWAFPLEPVLISSGEAGAALRARIWSSAVYLPVLFLAVQSYGLIGAGWARLFASVVVFAAFLLPVIRWFRGQALPATPPARAARDEGDGA